MSSLKLKRHPKNPILTPNKNAWENLLVFNPGAVMKDGKVHMLYRAMGSEDAISRLGHALSTDGINFVRDPDPAYYGFPTHENETLGIEDPRCVNIDGTIYITYTAVTQNHWAYIDPKWKEPISKIARVSLSTTTNFLNYRDYDVILPDFEAKNASLFPKTVGGEYWLLFRKGLVTYFANSNRVDYWPKYYQVFKPRADSWDSLRTGIGNPPIETEKGWLIFYHGVDKKNIYRLGIIVLDLNDPKKVVYRSQDPILEPETDYEHFGFFPNLVFACGAVEIYGTYFVYYGAADSVIGVATISKEEILSAI